MPVVGPAVGARFNAAPVRRIYSGANIIEPGRANLHTAASFDVPAALVTIRTNQTIDPNGQNGITYNQAGATLTLSADSGNRGKITGNAAVPADAILVQQRTAMTCAAGDVISGSIWVTNETANPLALYYQASAFQTGGTVQTGASPGVGVTLQPGETRMLFFDGWTTPALTACYRTLLRNSTVMSNGDVLHFQGLTSHVGPVAHNLPFSGITPAAGSMVYAWAGTPNASPSTERSTTLVTTRTNVALNPNAVGAGGWLPNNSAINTVTKNTPITGGPQGIATAAKGGMAAGHAATAALFSTYNIDGLSNTGAARWHGAWAWVSVAGYQAYWYQDGVAKAVALTPQVWTWVPSLSMLAANTYSGFYIVKLTGTGNVTDDTDYCLVTGVTSDTAYRPIESIWGDRPGAGDFNYSWTGPTNAGQSVEKAPISNGSATGANTVTRASNEHHSGLYSARCLCSGTGATEGFVTPNIPGSAHTNIPVAAGVWVKAPVGALIYFSIRLANSVSFTEGRTNFTGTGTWQWVTATHVPDATGTGVQIHIRTQTTQAITFYVDDLIVDDSASMPDYKDGGYPGWSWDGAVGASVSRGIH